MREPTVFERTDPGAKHPHAKKRLNRVDVVLPLLDSSPAPEWARVALTNLVRRKLSGPDIEALVALIKAERAAPIAT